MRRFALAFALTLVGPALLACEPRIVEPPSQKAPEPGPAPLAPTPVETSPEPPIPSEPTLELFPGEAAGIQYFELITGDAERDATLPMIVAIHGLGDTPENFANLFASFDRPARVILPRAIDAHEDGGWSWFPFRARDPDVEALAKSIAAASDQLAPAIAELSEDRPTRGKPIVTGFSQGGMLTFMLAVEHPELLDHAIVISGWLPPPRWPKGKPPADTPTIVALHGDVDKAVAFEPTRAAIDHLNSKGWSAELHRYPDVGHAIPPPMRDELFTLLRGYLEETQP
jgi:phospholipase/carboxylesterase